MSVRLPSAGDAPELARVHVESWQHAYRDIFSADFLGGLDVERRRLWFESRIAGGGGLLVADVDERPVGFCVFGDSAEPGWGEVYAIYVHPDHWGEGHGAALLSAAEDALSSQGLDRALLWVLERNHQARSFYERRGWVLGSPIKLEEIGGTQVTEVRYQTSLRGAASTHRGHQGK